MAREVVLVQKLDTPIYGMWDGGPRSTFRWSVDREYSDGKAKVGSWDANRWYEVAAGGTEKQTLGNVRRKLTAQIKAANERKVREGKADLIKCTFTYEE